MIKAKKIRWHRNCPNLPLIIYPYLTGWKFCRNKCEFNVGIKKSHNYILCSHPNNFKKKDSKIKGATKTAPNLDRTFNDFGSPLWQKTHKKWENMETLNCPWNPAFMDECRFIRVANLIEKATGLKIKKILEDKQNGQRN